MLPGFTNSRMESYTTIHEGFKILDDAEEFTADELDKLVESEDSEYFEDVKTTTTQQTTTTRPTTTRQTTTTRPTTTQKTTTTWPTTTQKTTTTRPTTTQKTTTTQPTTTKQTTTTQKTTTTRPTTTTRSTTTTRPSKSYSQRQAAITLPNHPNRSRRAFDNINATESETEDGTTTSKVTDDEETREFIKEYIESEEVEPVTTRPVATKTVPATVEGFSGYIENTHVRSLLFTCVLSLLYYGMCHLSQPFFAKIGEYVNIHPQIVELCAVFGIIYILVTIYNAS